MFILPDGRPISPDVPFSLGGISYPANWLRLSTEKQRLDIGITEVPDPPTYDQRFYWGPDLPKDHGQLVEQWTQQTRHTANTLLQPTDWIIIREADNGKEADPLLKVWRQDIRFAAGEKVTAIAATADTAELAAYITGTEYPVWPRDPYAPVPPSDAPGDGVEPVGDGGEG